MLSHGKIETTVGKLSACGSTLRPSCMAHINPSSHSQEAEARPIPDSVPSLASESMEFTVSNDN